MTRCNNLLELAILFMASLFIFTIGLSSQEIISFDSRFYLFALEMWRHGPSIFPMTYENYYPDYPGTATYLIYLSSSIFGALNKLTAVLPSAIAAAATVVMTYLIGTLRDKRWAWNAVFILFLTLTFLKSARSIALDMYPTFLTACCFYLIYSADMQNAKNRVWWIYPLMLLSFAFRGPIGIVIPAAVVGVYYLLQGRIKKMIITGVISALLLMASASLLLLLARHVGGETFMQDVLRMEVVGRMDSHFQPFYFYFTNGTKNYLFAFPLAFLVMFGALGVWLKTRKIDTNMRFLLLCSGWMLVVMVGMSIPGDKKIRYVLPVVPAAALLGAYIFVAEGPRYFEILRMALRKLFLWMPALFVLISLYLWHYTDRHALEFHIHYLRLIPFLLLIQTISIWARIYYGKENPMRDVRALFFAALSFVVMNYAVVEPIELNVDRAREFVAHVESLRLQEHADLVFYRERPDSMPIKYILNMPIESQPVFLENEKQLLDYQRPAYFVTSTSYYDELPQTVSKAYKVIAHDQLGHVAVTVFIKRDKHHE